jgi:GTP:adenosylcobinamide-phosphate guanylyltransferase
MDNLAVILQAGGQGKRLGKYTENLPKALIRVKSKTLLAHNLDILYQELKQDQTFIIADYKADLIRDFLNSYPHPSDPKICTTISTGTCAGLSDILPVIQNKSLLYVWCDLLLMPEDLQFAKKQLNEDLIFLSNTFTCRWSYINNSLTESPSSTCGVAGVFFFKSTHPLLNCIPKSGEFVRWLSYRDDYQPKALTLKATLELGDIKQYESYLNKVDVDRTRFFNTIRMTDETVIKKCVCKNYDPLLSNEASWYQFVNSTNYPFAPRLISSGNPLVLERIHGVHPDLIKPNQKVVISVLDSLKSLHEIDQLPPCMDSLYDVYITKTIARLSQVRSFLPLAADMLSINNVSYINPWSPRNIDSHIHNEALELLLNDSCKFSVIHGDPTFSNIIISGEKAFLIDPRGVFGKSRIHGDRDYDYAKLLYSIVGSYDSFNRHLYSYKKLSNESYLLFISPSGYEPWADLVYELATSRRRLDLIHSLIWFSLTGYCSNSIDSILASFLQGIIYYNKYYLATVRLSTLPKTWFLDLDGTLVPHNSHLQFGNADDTLLPGVHDLLTELDPTDTIVITTSRKAEDCSSILDEISRISTSKNIRLIADLGVGERIIFNDLKPSGLKTAYAFNLQRDTGLRNIYFRVDSTL